MSEDDTIQFRRYKLSPLDLRRQRGNEKKSNANNHHKHYSPSSYHHDNEKQSLASKKEPFPSSSSSSASFYANGFGARRALFHPFYNIRNHSSSRARVMLSERIEVGPPFAITKERSFLFRRLGLEEEDETDDYSEESEDDSCNSSTLQQLPLPLPLSEQNYYYGGRSTMADPEIIPPLRQQQTFDSYTSGQPSTGGGNSVETLKASNPGV
jgi:hypothetical protein